MKKCCTCNQYLDLTMFNIRRSSPDGRQPRCRRCGQIWYQVNRESHKKNTMARTKAARVANRAFLAD